MFNPKGGMAETYAFLMSDGLGVPSLEGYRWMAKVAQTHEEELDALDAHETVEAFLMAISSPTMVACAKNDKREEGWWLPDDDNDDDLMDPNKCPGHPDDWYWDDQLGWCPEDDLPW